MTIQEKIEKLRKEKHWTKAALALKAGVSRTTVYNWFNEKHATPTRESIENICAACKITIASFYSDIEEASLTGKETLLLEYFKALSEEKKDALIEMAKLLAK